MKTIRRPLLPIALLALLAGCGNKGPLVHPPKPMDEMAVPASTAPAAPAETTSSMPATSTTPTDATLPAPASTASAAPAETVPPPPPPPGGD